MSKHSPRTKSAIPDFASSAAPHPAHVKKMLAHVRSTIKRAVREAAEVIRYNIPAFTLHDRVIIYFGAFKGHIGLYPRCAVRRS